VYVLALTYHDKSERNLIIITTSWSHDEPVFSNFGDLNHFWNIYIFIVNPPLPEEL
jgi:hypothetical protein